MEKKQSYLHMYIISICWLPLPILWVWKVEVIWWDADAIQTIQRLLQLQLNGSITLCNRTIKRDHKLKLSSVNIIISTSWAVINCDIILVYYLYCRHRAAIAIAIHTYSTEPWPRSSSHHDLVDSFSRRNPSTAIKEVSMLMIKVPPPHSTRIYHDLMVP